jgi:hypothetical protein
MPLRYTRAMFSSWIRKCVLAAALAVLPLHGIAATLAVLICHGEAQGHAAHAPAGHDHGEHQHDTAPHDHQGAANSDDGNAAAAYHLCCNLTASAPPIATLAAELPEFPVRAVVPDILHDRYIPDQPQRPPLA